ncbi:chemotaxis protein CheY [Vibrio galatheae]|uniref:Chemotaxis protein CheY n=1 Tax=Vibrio galatheae TaxID=579748 RepID=A0A0F4NK97_9VIBR|nr:HD domain-containing phosphohydrolase [Vibrio galatheae]KJY83507.1 chemotaxis protein CheY [Vibrio galatheae]
MPFRKTILCIDDEPVNLALMRSFLEELYILKYANGGISGFESAVKHQPDLILVDVDMPDLNGFELTRKIKQRDDLKNIPVIFVTASKGEVDENKGFEVGGVDYISKPISEPILKARIHTHLSLVKASELEDSQRSALHMLGEAGHFNDTDTGVHIWRMAEYAKYLAFWSGWSREDSELLEMAAPMHDTGKIGIPDTILKKPGKLDENEWEVMKKHSQIGYDILSKSDNKLFNLAAEIALGHHEKWDGSGYPEGLAGDAIPESARIVAVADVFDALTMKRPYKDAWPIPKVLETLREMSIGHLEKRLVDIFIDHIEEIKEIKSKWDKKETSLVR